MSIAKTFSRAIILASTVSVFALSIGCGDSGGDSGSGDNIDAPENSADGSTSTPDGPPGAGVDGPPGSGVDGPPGSTTDGMTGDGECVPGGAQCNNCIDDDDDGVIDGADPECISAEDNDEGSFATGLPGDNQDAVKQDCFFDGNSGGGQYGCDIHVCCLLDDPGTAEEECPGDLKPGQYDPETSCEVPPSCVDFCRPATPPGCDCFGCCTIYDENDVPHDVILEADCSTDNLDACTSCTKVTECSNDCDADPADCILCPGQTEEDLPPECNDMNQCPEGQQVCDPANPSCPAGAYCYQGCCIAPDPE